jgi:hypothetical protein
MAGRSENAFVYLIAEGIQTLVWLFQDKSWTPDFIFHLKMAIKLYFSIN